VIDVDVWLVIEVGDGAGNFDGFEIASGSQAEFGSCLGEKIPEFIIQSAIGSDLFGGHLGIAGNMALVKTI
jgi:hypothetical protein